MILYTVLLFVLLTPGILVRLPPSGNKWTVAFVHGLIYSLIYYFTHNFIMRLSSGLEGFQEGLGPGCSTTVSCSGQKHMITCSGGGYKCST